jgi:hypothetical protein
MVGIPVRFEKTVKMSAKYMEMGSSVFSPMVKAVEGAVGSRMASNWLKIRFIFSTSSLRTCCALVY